MVFLLDTKYFDVISSNLTQWVVFMSFLLVVFHSVIVSGLHY